MLELRIMNAGTAMPLFDLPAALGRRQAAKGIADTIEGLIAFLDEIGGDPDLEANGDELDGNASEDDFMYHAIADTGAGCPIADPGGARNDDDEDDAPHIRAPYRTHIRRTRCVPVDSRYGGGYRLRVAS